MIVRCNTKCKHNKKGLCSKDEILIFTGHVGYDWSFAECRDAEGK